MVCRLSTGASWIRTSSPTVVFAVARAGRETISIGEADSPSLLEGPTVRIRFPPAVSQANFQLGWGLIYAPAFHGNDTDREVCVVRAVTQPFAAKLFTLRGQHRPTIYIMRLKVVFTELCWMAG
jgi:hypothetical protein